jgi:hypothetical protein
MYYLINTWGGQSCLCSYLLPDTGRYIYLFRGRRGHHHMVVGFTTTYAIGAYHHWRLRVRCTTLCGKVCQWLAAGWWFSQGTPVSSTNKTDSHYITEKLLKVALNTIKPKTKIYLLKPHILNISQSNLYLIKFFTIWSLTAIQI